MVGDGGGWMAGAFDFPLASLPLTCPLLSPTPLCSMEGHQLGLDLWKHSSPTLHVEALVGRLPNLHHAVGGPYGLSGSAPLSVPIQAAGHQESSGLLGSACLNSHQSGTGHMGGLC